MRLLSRLRFRRVLLLRVVDLGVRELRNPCAEFARRRPAWTPLGRHPRTCRCIWTLVSLWHVKSETDAAREDGTVGSF